MDDDSPKIIARYCWPSHDVSPGRGPINDVSSVPRRSPGGQHVAPSLCELMSPLRHHRFERSPRPHHLDPSVPPRGESNFRPDADPVLLKIWDCCATVASDILQKHDLGPEGEPQGLPLQFLLLTACHIRLDIPWDDTLRVVRRYVEPVDIAFSPHPPAMSLAITPFVRCLQQLIEIHLSSVDRKEARRSNPPEFQSLSEFTRSLWIGSKELSRLRFFLQSSFEGPIRMASLMTASVLDVFSAYKDRLEWLQQSLIQLSMCDIDGVTLALCQLCKLSGANATIPSSSNEAKMFVGQAFPSFFCGEDQQGCPNVRTYNGFCEWIAMLSSAASLSKKSNQHEPFHTTHVRSAVLDVLGEALGSLLLPFSVVAEVLRQGMASTLAARESDRLRLKQSMEQSLQRLYIHYCGAQDINGFGLLTGHQMKRMLGDSRVLDRMPEVERLSIDSLIIPRPERDAASPSRQGKSVRVATESRRDTHHQHDSCSREISFSTFLTLIDKIEQISTPISGSAGALPLSQLLLSSPAGLEALRSVPSNIADVTDDTVASTLQSPAPTQMKSWYSRGPTQRSKGAPVHWVTVGDALQCLFERLLYAEDVHRREESRKCSTAPYVVNSSSTSCVSFEFLIRVLTKCNIIPSMMSRADASRAIRKLKIMRADRTAVKLEDFEWLAVCAGSSPRTKLTLNEGIDLIIRSLEKGLMVTQQ